MDQQEVIDKIEYAKYQNEAVQVVAIAYHLDCFDEPPGQFDLTAIANALIDRFGREKAGRIEKQAKAIANS